MPVKYARAHKTRALIDFDRSDDSRVNIRSFRR